MAKELLTERYAGQIRGMLSCFDRVVISGTIPQIRYADAMTAELNRRKIRIFDYSRFAEPLRDEIRHNAEHLAEENGLKIEFIRRLNFRNFRKEKRIKKILRERGDHPGLVHFSRRWNRARPFDPGTTSRLARRTSSIVRPSACTTTSTSSTRSWPLLPTGSDVGTVPAPVLLQWPQPPGGEAAGGWGRLHAGGECLPRDRGFRQGSGLG